jgi:hypothetical protein
MYSALCLSQVVASELGDLQSWKPNIPVLPDRPWAGAALYNGVSAARWGLLLKACGGVAQALLSHLKVWQQPAVFVLTAFYLPKLDRAFLFRPRVRLSHPNRP